MAEMPLYLSNSLMFGSTAAVYSFNRVSRAIWFLINRLLWIPAGVYYVPCCQLRERG